MINSKLLIIDDSIENLKLMVSVFENLRSGIEIFQTNNPLKAFEIAQQTLPDLIITDWNMPFMNGIELIEQIKESPKLNNIPVIIATGIMLSNSDLQLALDAGAVDYIRKPIDPIELIARSNSAIQISRYHKQLMDIKEKELAENILQFVKKQELIEGIIKKLRSIEQIDLLDKIKIETNRLIADLDRSQREDSWQKLDVSFSQIHIEFKKNILEECPSLSPTELKICVLIKLGLSTKNIASVLNQTIDSVKTSRYRIRKKFKFESGISLGNFILKF